jgi:hypothetical protein
MSVELIGPYHADADGGGGTHRAAIGWSGLKIGRIIQGKAAPYRIDDHEGPIGWAPASSFRLKGTCGIFVGLIVVVS